MESQLLHAGRGTLSLHLKSLVQIRDAPTHEEEQASAIVEKVVGRQARNAKAVAQLHPEQVQDGCAQQGGHVHEGVEQGECKAPAAGAAGWEMRCAHATPEPRPPACSWRTERVSQ